MNDNLNYQELFTRLSKPFHPQDIEWRAGATNADKTKALALAYLTSRAVMDRLDEVIGPENWKDEYKPGPDGGVTCGLSLRINGEWITKWDGADNTDIEAIKGGLSDAFKRVGVKWGIGRYLYKLDSVWVPCEVRGKSVALTSHPTLPAWALPDGPKTITHNDPPPKTNPRSEPPPNVISDREKEIMKELGFGDPIQPKEQPAPKNNGTNGTNSTSGSGNGNGQDSTNGKRPQSWNSNLVGAVMKAQLANTPVEAVRLLNESDLSPSITPEQAVQALRTKVLA